MSEYLFSYGTLLPGRAPREVAGLVFKLRALGEGTVRGILYDLRNYPGAVLGHVSGGKIFGMVFRLPKDPAVLRKLDDYEGFDGSAPGKSLFVRRPYPVMLRGGQIRRWWVYEYNGKLVAARVIADGRWQA